MDVSVDIDRGRRSVGSIEKAFRVLAVFNATGRPMSLTELAAESGVERSATHRILYTLRNLGYVRQDRRTRQFRLGAKLLELGDTYNRMNGVRAAAQPILEAASQRCEETVNLTVMEGAEVVYVLRYPSRHVVSVDLRIGSRLPVYCTAPGRAMLAFLDPATISEILDQSDLVAITPFTITDRGEIERILDKIRHDACCTTNQEAFLGDISVAATVFDAGGFPVAAVNIAVPYPRWSLTRVQSELSPVVIDCARRISRSLAGG
jgi:IclR family pca regulon transcriptional regulator